MKLSELLKNARAERGLSLEAAAREMGTTKGHLHDMEQGRATNPTIKTVAGIIIAYNIPASMIVASVLHSEPAP